MILKLKKVNVLKLSFFFAVLYALLSIIVFIVMMFASTVSGQMFPWYMIFILPVVYGIGGFVGGLIMGALYNMVSRWIGGLEFDFDEIEKFSE